RIIDDACRTFLVEHPDAVVVNLGAGMDTRYSRLDNGRVLWFDLDLPEVIQIREQLFERSKRMKFLAFTVSDFTWMSHVPRNRPALFIAEALLSYLEEHEVKAIVRTIAERFPGSEMIAEATSLPNCTAAAAGAMKKIPPVKWGVASLGDLETWRSGVTLEEQWFPLDYYENVVSLDLLTWLALR
ncbi:MAG: class I SAM-dependent methyltransferase, partial [Gammaproteobacteria bacterium]|nr:class I SAM-dependent methyltransferase [Gammaproteobacteria bacterium]